MNTVAPAGLLTLTAGVEQNSEHPVTEAIVEAARSRGLKLTEAEEFQAVPGFGVEARVNGRLVQVGADCASR